MTIVRILTLPLRVALGLVFLVSLVVTLVSGFILVTLEGE